MAEKLQQNIKLKKDAVLQVHPVKKVKHLHHSLVVLCWDAVIKL